MHRRFIQSVKCALAGIRSAWVHELSFRIQAAAGVLVCIAMVLFGFSYAEFCFVLLAMVLVLGAEMLNTIAEEVLDVIEPRVNVHVGHVKDLAAGVVLLLSCFAAAIGFLTLIHHFQIPNPFFLIRTGSLGGL